MKKSTNGILLTLLVAFSLFSVALQIKMSYNSKINIANSNDELITPKATYIGGWIIIGGDRDDHDKLEWIKYTCNKTYEILVDCGYTAAEIYYLFPDADWNIECAYADDYCTRDNIHDAIEIWAVGQIGAGEALGIYMMDHGGVDVLPVPGPAGVDLTANNLDTYLNNYETSTGNNRTIIVYDACHSGSFINNLAQDNRIIVTSTSDTLNAFGCPPFFFDAFWSASKNSKTIGEAFEEAEASIHALGYGDTQKPWIDDNHDGVGHETDATGNLPNGGDGNDALNTKIHKSFIWRGITFAKLPLKWWVPLSMVSALFSTVIQNITPIKEVFLRVRAPYWVPPVPPQPDPYGVVPFVADNALYVPLWDEDGNGNYSGVIYSKYFQRFPVGEYKLNVIARSTEGDWALESTSFYTNQAGTPPPDTTDPTVKVTNPVAESEVTGMVLVKAEGDDDQALEKIELYIDGVLVNTTTMPDYYPYPEATFLWNSLLPIPGGAAVNETHVIAAKAIDKAGNSAVYSISVNFQPIAGFEFSVAIIGCFLVVAAIHLLRSTKKPTLIF